MGAIRLTMGEFYADIIFNRRSPDEVWMYVVQRHGSADILALGSCASEPQAREAATLAMQHLGARAASAS